METTISNEPVTEYMRLLEDLRVLVGKQVKNPKQSVDNFVTEYTELRTAVIDAGLRVGKTYLQIRDVDIKGIQQQVLKQDRAERVDL